MKKNSAFLMIFCDWCDKPFDTPIAKGFDCCDCVYCDDGTLLQRFDYISPSISNLNLVINNGGILLRSSAFLSKKP
jgi:hypothetical protein